MTQKPNIPNNNETTEKALDYTVANQIMDEVIEAAKKYITTHTSEEVEKTLMETYLFARDAHSKQIRKSGEPYINHPVSVAKILL